MASPLRVPSLPAELADRKQLIETTENIGSFPRLAAILEGGLATARAGPGKWRQLPVEITLRFGWAGGGRQFVGLTGSVAARMAAACRRCLLPFEYTVREELRLLLLQPGDATTDEPGFEAWELDEESLRPADIVEEVLIMALPLVPGHDDEAACRPETETTAAAERTGMTTPFADLRSRMRE